MSKCKAFGTAKFFALETHGVTLADVTKVTRNRAGGETSRRDVVISIPYEALRDIADVQLAFQDLVTISTTP